MKIPHGLVAAAAALAAATASITVGITASIAVGAGSASARTAAGHDTVGKDVRSHVQRLAVRHHSRAYMHDHYSSKHTCATASPGQAACAAEKLVPLTGSAAPSASPAAITGLTPANIQSAYGLTGLTTGSTVAIVDAYGYPRAEADLAAYRAQFGLPACTTANGCLKIVNQTGGSTLPAFNLGWAQEQALDLDAVSAACPSCKILLVQATSPTFANLGTAVNTAAAAPGVKAVSNSYGGSDSLDLLFGKYYKHPGVAITASAGDKGYQGGSYPASSQWVTAVGGTTLTPDSSSRGWSEKVWSGTGSGCSFLNTKLASQSYSRTGCFGRAMNDVAAVADPYTGLAVYGPKSATTSAWAQYGGTSLSSPIIASVYALSGNTAGYANTIPYAHTSALWDVTSGSNGYCLMYCSAKVGYDFPTGLGTPHGTGAF